MVSLCLHSVSILLIPTTYSLLNKNLHWWIAQKNAAVPFGSRCRLLLNFLRRTDWKRKFRWMFSQCFNSMFRRFSRERFFQLSRKCFSLLFLRSLFSFQGSNRFLCIIGKVPFALELRKVAEWTEKIFQKLFQLSFPTLHFWKEKKKDERQKLSFTALIQKQSKIEFRQVVLIVNCETKCILGLFACFVRQVLFSTFSIDRDWWWRYR